MRQPTKPTTHSRRYLTPEQLTDLRARAAMETEVGVEFLKQALGHIDALEFEIQQKDLRVKDFLADFAKLAKRGYISNEERPILQARLLEVLNLSM